VSSRVEVIIVLQVLYSPFADFRSSIIRNQTVQEYFSASAIRIRLVRPSDETELASYYAVSSLQIEGSCLCYGHADSCMGLVCVIVSIYFTDILVQ